MSANIKNMDEQIQVDASLLSAQLHSFREQLFVPSEKKQLRSFSSAEVAKIIGVTETYVRKIVNSNSDINVSRSTTGRISFSMDQINYLRGFLGKGKTQPDIQRQGFEHLQVISVCNFKGGSGKTTSAIHLAQYCAMHGYRVLAIDLDPQASMTALFGLQPEFDVKENRTLYGAIRYDEMRVSLAEVIHKTYFPNLDLIPANLELHEFEHETPLILATKNREGNLFFKRIMDALTTVNENYDIVVIDCPPQLGFLTMTALFASTGMLITVHPQMLDIASMSQFLTMTAQLMNVVRKAGGSLNYDWIKYLITRHEPYDGPQAQVVGFLRSMFGDRVLTAMMLKSTAITDAGLSNMTIYEMARDSMNRQTYERALEAMDSVNAEITSLLEKSWGRASK